MSIIEYRTGGDALASFRVKAAGFVLPFNIDHDGTLRPAAGVSVRDPEAFNRIAAQAERMHQQTTGRSLKLQHRRVTPKRPRS